MSKWRPAIVTLLVIVSSGLIKAHVHFIKVALICAFGLMGMYLLHQLALDWNRIANRNRPANRPSAGSMVGGGSMGMRPQKIIGKLFRLVKRSAEPHPESISTFGKLVEKFTGVLLYDPMGCARKFLCYVGSKPMRDLTERDTSLLRLFEFRENETTAFKIFKKAVILGRTNKDTTICEETYNSCYLTNDQLNTFYKHL